MNEHHNVEEQKERLYEVMATLNTPERVKAFLADLCTDNEIEYMAQRNESARLLLEGYTYQQVVDNVNISTATLSRVNRCIKHGQGGYNTILATYLKEKKQ